MRTKRLMTLAAAGLAAVLLAAPAAASTCYSATTSGPVMLPDGQVRAGGQLRICRFKELSPSSTLHSLSIDGVDYGLFMGRRQPVEAAAGETAAFVFARAGDQTLQLQALAYHDRGRWQAFRAELIGRGRVTTHATMRLAQADVETVVVPAVAD